MYYTAKIVQDSEENREAYNITFPDIPMAISCAFSMPQAIEYAQDVLELVLEDVLDGCMKLPKRTVEPDEKKHLYRIDIGARMTVALEVCQAKGRSKANSIAKKMGITPQSFAKLMKPSSNVSISMLEKFAKAVGKKLEVKIV
ncbi:HicB_like antitoxin of toxin-antitoxin system [Fibrobacter sp. UWH5]|uniref:type II toxin-antitoxin system HicB family antitoxin n=1 Tax=Fibrobacter sp. UWH5 TaxID=1896211 RepID=UPI000917CAFC|nr:type II toxin-antitoxin system HicB family antitoxin [Fibrobacter sp. UWH5]SHL44210.1 HicB_like antitoxin of toxin-antitoxin system [Fibrobacter sp. UWH5]